MTLQWLGIFNKIGQGRERILEKIVIKVRSVELHFRHGVGLAATTGGGGGKAH